jgi:hypothetical protein
MGEKLFQLLLRRFNSAEPVIMGENYLVSTRIRELLRYLVIRDICLIMKLVCNSNCSIKHILIDCVDVAGIRQTLYNVNTIPGIRFIYKCRRRHNVEKESCQKQSTCCSK